MEHSRGEATFSEPGVPGDLGLLAELGDLGTVAVGLLLLVGGMVMCHTCGLDDMVLGCRTMETTMSDLDCSFPARSVSHSLPIPLHCTTSEMPVGTSANSPHPCPTSRFFCSSCTPALPSSSHALSGVSTLGCPSLAGPCGPLLSEPLPPALAYLTVPLGRNIRALLGWTLVIVIPRATVQKRQLRGAPGCHRKSVALGQVKLI